MTTMGGSGIKILHAAGTTLPESQLVPSDSGHVQAMISEAVAAAKKADTVVAVLGESAAQSGEAKSRSDIGLPQEQKERSSPPASRSSSCS